MVEQSDKNSKISITIVGANGRMGQNNIALFNKKKDTEITTLFDQKSGELDSKEIHSLTDLYKKNKNNSLEFIENFKSLVNTDTNVVDFSSCQGTIQYLILFYLMKFDFPIFRRKSGDYFNKEYVLKDLLNNFFNELFDKQNLLHVIGFIEEILDFIKDAYGEKRIINNHPCYIIGTTGFTEQEEEIIKHLAKKMPIIMSGNFSIGINVLTQLVEKTAKILGEEYDIEMIEHHHNQKVDAPSGTAKMLLQSAQRGRGWEDEKIVNTQRDGVIGKRSKKEIGMFAIRGGGVVGHHEALYLSENDKITLSHTAFNRNAFTSGVYRAVKYAEELKKNPKKKSQAENSKKNPVISMAEVLGFE